LQERVKIPMQKKFFTLLFLGIFNLLSPPTFSRDAVSGAEVTGTFEDRLGSTFKILALGKGKLQVDFSGIYPYQIGKMKTANTGEAAGEASIQADTSVFKPEGFEKSCTITLHFAQPGKLEVTQQGDSADCGFGMNVSAEGSYQKISAKKPKSL